MRVLVCGSRDYMDTPHVYATLDAVHAKHTITLIIEGGQTGADRRARAWAINRRVPYETVEADWTQYGAAAGPIRNSRMLAEFAPDAVVAFPGGRGTRDMTRKARAAGLPVWDVPPSRVALASR